MLHLLTLWLLALPIGSFEYSNDYTTWHTEHWRQYLSHLVGVDNAQGLEIGCYEGRSTIWLEQHIFTGKDAHMTCVEVSTKQLELVRRNIDAAGLTGEVVALYGPSQHVLRGLPINHYDFVYVDGCHLAHCALADLVNAYLVTKPGGLIMIDDLSMGRVWRAFAAFVRVFTEPDPDDQHVVLEVLEVRRHRRATDMQPGVSILRKVGEPYHDRP